MHALLLFELAFLLAVQPWYAAEEWDAATWDESQCFEPEQAVPKSDRVDIFYKGQGSPLKILYLDWTLARVNRELATIILEEKVGFNVDRSTDAKGCCSWSGVRATVPGCVPVGNKTKRCEVTDDADGSPNGGHPYAHMAFELWKHYIPGGFKAYTDSLGLDDTMKPLLEDLSYRGEEALCIRPDLYADVWNTSGIDLSYFRFYDAKWFNVSQHFSTTAEAEAVVGRSPMACNLDSKKVSNFQGNTMSLYLELTGDADGVVKQSEKDIANCNGGWWRAPSCRDNPSKCIPVITMDSWLGHVMMQWAAFYNMPFAIGTYDKDERAAVNYKIISKARVLFYETMHLPQYSGLSEIPKKVVFPFPDVKDVRQGIFRTAVESNTLAKVSWRQLKDASKRASIFFEKYDVYQQEIGLIGIRALALSTADKRGDRKAACEWLRSTDRWKDWMPPPAVVCPAGTELNIDNICVACPRGRFNPVAGTDTRCIDCAMGSYQDRIGWPNCSLCVLGRANDKVGAEECALCTKGKYADQLGMLSCPSCPNGRYNPVLEQKVCGKCPKGANCIVDNQTAGAVTFVAAENYYLLHNITPYLVAFNFSGSNPNPESDAGIIGVGPVRCPVNGTCLGDNLCIEGMEGPLCGACHAGYARESSKKRCGRCASDAQNRSIAIFVIIVVYIGLLVMEQVNYVSAGNLRAVSGVVGKIFYNFSIQLSVVARLIRLDDLLDKLLNEVFATSVISPVLALVGLGKVLENPASSILSVSCMVRSVTQTIKPAYFNAILAVSAVPILLLLFASFICFTVIFTFCWSRYLPSWCIYTADPKRGTQSFKTEFSKQVADRFLPISVMLLYFLHPMVTTYALSLFECREFDQDTQLELDASFLLLDTRINCFSGEYLRWSIVAYVSIFAWSVGIPLFLGCLLRRVKNTYGLHSLSANQRYGFLYQGFEDQCYHYEIVYMLRRFIYLTVAAIPWISVGCRTAMLLGLNLFFFGMHLEVKPFDDRAYCGLDMLDSWSYCILIACFTGRWFQLGSEKMTGEFWNRSDGLAPTATKIAYLPCLLFLWIFIGRGIYLVLRALIWPLHTESCLPPWSVARFDRRLHISIIPMQVKDLKNDAHGAEHAIVGCVTENFNMLKVNRGVGVAKTLKTRERELFKAICANMIEVLLQRHELALGSAPEIVSLPTFIFQLERIFVGCYITALVSRLKTKKLLDERDSWKKYFQGLAEDAAGEVSKVLSRSHSSASGHAARISIDDRVHDIRKDCESHHELHDKISTSEDAQLRAQWEEVMRPMSAEEIQMALMTLTPHLLADCSTGGKYLATLAETHQDILNLLADVKWVFQEDHHADHVNSRTLGTGRSTKPAKTAALMPINGLLDGADANGQRVETDTVQREAPNDAVGSRTEEEDLRPAALQVVPCELKELAFNGSKLSL